MSDLATQAMARIFAAPEVAALLRARLAELHGQAELTFDSRDLSRESAAEQDFRNEAVKALAVDLADEADWDVVARILFPAAR